MHTEVVWGDVGERLRTFGRVMLSLGVDIGLVALWVMLQWGIGQVASAGLFLGEYRYTISPNIRLVIALGSLAPIAVIIYADLHSILKKESESSERENANQTGFVFLLAGCDGRFVFENSPEIARSLLARRIALASAASGMVVLALLTIIVTGGSPETGLAIAAASAAAAIVGNRLRNDFLAALTSFTFSLTSVCNVLAGLVLGAERIGLSPTLTAFVMVAGIVVGADLIILMKVIRSGWLDHRSSREDEFAKRYYLKIENGAVDGVGLDDKAVARELVLKALKAIHRIPGTPEDANEMRELTLVSKKCWRKYSQILEFVEQGTRAEIALYRQALLSEDRVSRFCEQLLTESKQLSPGGAPRHRVYTATAGRRQLKELLLEWNVSLSEIIERERELVATPRPSDAAGLAETRQREIDA